MITHRYPHDDYVLHWHILTRKMIILGLCGMPIYFTFILFICTYNTYTHIYTRCGGYGPLSSKLIMWIDLKKASTRKKYVFTYEIDKSRLNCGWVIIYREKEVKYVDTGKNLGPFVIVRSYTIFGCIQIW